MFDVSDNEAPKYTSNAHVDGMTWHQKNFIQETLSIYTSSTHTKNVKESKVLKFYTKCRERSRDNNMKNDSANMKLILIRIWTQVVHDYFVHSTRHKRFKVVLPCYWYIILTGAQSEYNELGCTYSTENIQPQTRNGVMIILSFFFVSRLFLYVYNRLLTFEKFVWVSIIIYLFI